MLSKLTKVEKSWILYDIANSAFILLATAILPIYFKNLVTENGMSAEVATGYWGTITSIAVVILAIASPILGTVADYKGMKKKLFAGFLFLGLGGLFSLSIVTSWVSFLCLYVVTRIGYTACNIFYDAMLTDVATEDKLDVLSTLGYAFGYVGSCIPFIIGIVLIFVDPFHLGMVVETRLTFIITGLWWLLLTIPLLKNVKQTYYVEAEVDMISQTFKRLGNTFRKIKKDKQLLLFMLGYFCYIDGVYTIISMATSYGAAVGIDDTQLVVALLVTQFVAFPFAVLSGKYANKIGALNLIKWFILGYIGVCFFGYQLDKAWEFWFLAICVGMFQGGIQALSRSYFAKLIPREESNEYFGFFDIFGKFADFVGPMIVAIFSFFGYPQAGVLALAVLFVMGYVLIHKSETYKNNV